MQRPKEEIAEIERHKYFLSEKRGYDVGWEFAEQDWESQFARHWRQESRRPDAGLAGDCGEAAMGSCCGENKVQQHRHADQANSHHGHGSSSAHGHGNGHSTAVGSSEACASSCAEPKSETQAGRPAGQPTAGNGTTANGLHVIGGQDANAGETRRHDVAADRPAGPLGRLFARLFRRAS